MLVARRTSKQKVRTFLAQRSAPTTVAVPGCGQCPGPHRTRQSQQTVLCNRASSIRGVRAAPLGIDHERPLEAIGQASLAKLYADQDPFTNLVYSSTPATSGEHLLKARNETSSQLLLRFYLKQSLVPPVIANDGCSAHTCVAHLQIEPEPPAASITRVRGRQSYQASWWCYVDALTRRRSLTFCNQ